MQQPIDQLDRLERKVDFLTWVVSVQAVLLAVITVKYLVQFVWYVVVIGIILIPILFVFRRSLPDWARRTGHVMGRIDRLFRRSVSDGQPSP